VYHLLIMNLPEERRVIEFPPPQPAQVRGCRVETFGGLEMESAVNQHDRLNDLSGEVFSGTEDRADE